MLFAGRPDPDDAGVYQELGRKAGDDAGRAKERPEGEGQAAGPALRWESPLMSDALVVLCRTVMVSDIDLSVSAGGGVCHVGDGSLRGVGLVPLKCLFLSTLC